MNKKLVQGIVVGAVVLVAGLAWLLYSPANNANFPGGTDWMCLNPKCQTNFNLSIKDLAQYSKDHVGEPVKCPKCATEAIRAEKCQHCGKYFPMPRDAQHRCPYCGKSNAQPTEG
jgi:DNA-directed RNA polymerase subunit RPC12/RpoP